MSSSLDVFGRYEVIRKASFILVLSILALCRAMEVDWDSYVGVKNPFSGYKFSTGELSSLLPSRVARHKSSGPEASVSVPGRDVVWVPGIAYTSMKSCRADLAGCSKGSGRCTGVGGSPVCGSAGK